MYMANEDSEAPLGMISLAGTTVKAVRSVSGPTGFEVRLSVYGKNQRVRRVFRLCAETEDEVIKWAMAIDNNIKAIAAESRPSSMRSNRSSRRMSMLGVDITAAGPGSRQTFL